MEPTERNLILLTIACFAAALIATGFLLGSRKLNRVPRLGLVALATLLIFIAFLLMTRTLWWLVSSGSTEKKWMRSPSFYVTVGALLTSVIIWFRSQRPRSAKFRSFTIAILLLLAVGVVGASEKFINRVHRNRAVALGAGLQSCIGQRAPDFAFVDLDGHRHVLSEYRGKVVLLNIWTTSCSPCVHEMPDLSTLHGRFADRGFTLLLISPEDDQPLQTFFATHPTLGVKGRLLPDAPAPDFYHAYEAWPITFLIDRAGNVLDIWLGAPAPDWLRQRIESSL